MNFRPLAHADLDALIDLQEIGAIAALSHIFPQDRYPFQRDVIKERWRTEIDDPDVRAFAFVGDHDSLAGFAATKHNELFHFGTALELWGTGAAGELHAHVVADLVRNNGSEFFWLRVFEENLRARRFYEKLGWRLFGTHTQTTFAPHPYLVEYRIARSTAVQALDL
jgi:RimJ/RimL family protein N-acetyltransferase